jgi:hypothetical protein
LLPRGRQGGRSHLAMAPSGAMRIVAIPTDNEKRITGPLSAIAEHSKFTFEGIVFSMQGYTVTSTVVAANGTGISITNAQQ